MPYSKKLKKFYMMFDDGSVIFEDKVLYSTTEIKIISGASSEALIFLHFTKMYFNCVIVKKL